MKTLVRERECQHRNKTTAFRPVLLLGGRLKPSWSYSFRDRHWKTSERAGVFEHSTDANDNVASMPG
jgi:hypothetical protein